MKRFFTAIVISVLLVGVVHAAKTSRGTATEAVAMVERAVDYITANGQEAAFKEFNNPKGTFVDRDLYIWVVDLNGKILAHGADAHLIGKNLIDLRDVDGKAFLRDALRLAKVRNTGWFDYHWPDPTTKEIESKSTYFQRVGDFIVCCGIYYSHGPFGI